ncbi:MAG: phosphoglycerate dehydrogenase, partial [Lentisphaeria bacterium]|nr:phosphoglycerate dehydrogenase [Lentisphaeria bacterium]
MRKVLIPTKLDKVVAQILGEHGFEVIQNPDAPLTELAAANADAQAIIVRSEKVLPEVMDMLPDLKLVVRAGAGFDNIDTKYARRKNIDVMNTPGANSNSVAEEVVAMALAAYRKLVFADNTTRAGQWEKKSSMGRELTGKTVGILSLGNIGKLLAKRLSGFECKILAFDPMVSQDLADKLGITLCTVEEIFAQADIISLHIPENDKTRGMVNDKLLSLMKKGAMLINCARAGIIDEDAVRRIK